MNRYKCVTSKSEICKSNWTPVNHVPSKEAIYQERLKLTTNWFDMWTHPQKCQFFDHFLKRCDKKQLAHIERYFVESVPIDRIDFTTIFPRHLSLFIFSFLDPKTLSRAAVVSWHWRFLTEQDVLWIPKCTAHAWYLPFNPPQDQIGSWKRHYISCIKTLDFKICREEKSQWAEKQDDKQNKMIEKQLRVRSGKLWRSIDKSIKEKSLSSGDPWIPSNKCPNDFSDKKNYSKNKKNFVFGSFGLQRMDSGSCHVSGWKEMKDVLARMTDSDVEMMLEEGRHQTPPRLSDVLKLENLKEMRMTELKEFQNKHSKFWNPGNIVESSLIPMPYNVTSEFCVRSEVRKIIFVSSEVPAYDLLICSLQHDVAHLWYDFNSSTPDSLVFKLHSITKHAQHPSNIGFFTHRGKPGEFLLTKHLKMTRGCSTLEEMSKFFKTLTGLLRSEGGCVDIFQPVACCEELRQSLITFSSNCGVEFRSPMNVFNDKQIYDGPWFSTSNSSPPNVPSKFYFDRGRFMMWSNDSELMGEACNEVKSHLHGYFAGVRRQLISRAVGEVIRTSLGFVGLEKMEKFVGELTNGMLVSQDCPEDEIHTKLGKHLLGKSGHKHSETTDEDEVGRRKFDNSWIDATQGSSLHPGEIAKKFTAQRQLGRRSNQLKILDELISSEKYYNDCLRSLVDVYKRPIVVSLETNRALVSWQNARLLFDDVTQLFGISCQFLEDLKLMRINPSSQIFLGQLTLKFLKSFASLSSAYLLVYSAILDTYDKCKRQCTSFRAFLKRYESSPSSLMLSLPELYMKPWKRVNEYARMLTSYRDVLRHDHPDIRDLDACIRSVGELADSIDESVKRLISDHKMMTLQDKIKNCPQLNESGRHLIGELRASHMLAPCQSNVPELRVYRHSGDLHFYLFDDCLVCADVVVRNIPFESRQTEEQIFLQTSSIRFIRIMNIPDSPSMPNGFKMWTPKREWICSVDDDTTKFDWISTLEQTVKLHFNK